MVYPSISLGCRPSCVATRSLLCLPSIIDDLSNGHSRTLLVTSDPGTKKWVRVVADLFADIPHVTVQAVTNTPEGVVKVLDSLQNYGPRVIVALGGGAVMDAAKAAAALYKPDGRQDSQWAARDVLAATAERQDHRAIPVVAVPTTPGSGAEVTPNASLWDLEGKWTLRGAALRPQTCVLDPSLICGLGFSDLVSGLLDTLAHAVEAAWSIRSSDEGDRYATEAIRLVGEAAALLHGQPEASSKVLSVAQEAGHYAGHAIDATPTNSCHAVSYVLTRRRGLRHGHACALAMGRLLSFNQATTALNCVDRRGADYVHGVLRRNHELLAEHTESSPLELINGLLGTAKLVGLDELGMPAEQIADEALAYMRIHDNPRFVDPEALALAFQ